MGRLQLRHCWCTRVVNGWPGKSPSRGQVPAKTAGKNSMRKRFGSAISYARRYAFQAALNLAGEDDDGNAVSNPQRQARAATVTEKPAQAEQDTTNQPISDKQRKRLFALATEHNVAADQVKDFLFQR